MRLNSPQINIITKACMKASKSLIRDFGEIENWGKGIYRKLLFNKSFIDNKNKIIFEKTYYKE